MTINILFIYFFFFSTRGNINSNNSKTPTRLTSKTNTKNNETVDAAFNNVNSALTTLFGQAGKVLNKKMDQPTLIAKLMEERLNEEMSLHNARKKCRNITSLVTVADFHSESESD